ncbi:MAG: hypothetical protein KAS54_07885, partial [Dehalococcoidia bacterium]|nr:hypothetical protein [Dehalococcoidia bacterium]
MLGRATATTKQDRASPIATWLAARPLLTEVGLPALTVLFGIQALRVFLPGLVWLLGDRMSLGEALLGTIALLVFLAAFLAGGLQRLLGNRLLILVTAGGLGLLRLLMQGWSDKPVLDLSLAMAGMALFVVFVPTYLRSVRVSGSAGTGRFALGLLLGLVLDTALHSAFYTYDISWQPGLLPLLLTLLLV